MLLSPTDVPKHGPHFDLPIAVAVLAASIKDPQVGLSDAAMIGELTLDGWVRCGSSDGAWVRVVGTRSLAPVIALLRGKEVPEALDVEPLTGSPLLSWREEERLEDLDISDVMGMADTRALEVAAAGGHHLMLTGPEGSA